MVCAEEDPEEERCTSPFFLYKYQGDIELKRKKAQESNEGFEKLGEDVYQYPCSVNRLYSFPQFHGPNDKMGIEFGDAPLQDIKNHFGSAISNDIQFSNVDSSFISLEGLDSIDNLGFGGIYFEFDFKTEGYGFRFEPGLNAILTIDGTERTSKRSPKGMKYIVTIDDYRIE